MTATPESVLKQVFGYDAFRGFQREVIEHVCAGGDALVPASASSSRR
jgi:ATP-dependent DNA helicase RecQ